MKTIVQCCIAILGLLYLSFASAGELPIPSKGEDNLAIFEIRNYHYDPSQFDAYKEWLIEEAAPFFRKNLDVVGFWVGNEETPEISGTSPMELDLGSANVTWIIRWDSMEAREKINAQLFAREEWQNIWAKHPDPNGYLQVESRFAKGY